MKKKTIRSGKISFKALSRKETEDAFSPAFTKKIIELCKKMIPDKQSREQTIAFIRAADGKEIRNKSGV